MNRFTDCVSDIDEALRLGYPDNLHYKVSKQGDRWKDGNGRKMKVKCDSLQVLERKAKALQKLGENCEDEVDQLNQLVQKVTFKIKLF